LGAHVLELYNTPADPTAFEQYYRGTHIPIAKRMPGLRSYVVSKGPLASVGGAPYYLVAVLRFASMNAIQAAVGSPEGQAVLADIPKFATGGATIVMYETENV
jgi:uncharacterized protein (TIGR02118 family)